MARAFRTMILAAATIPLARDIAASFGPGGAGMWITPLSATGTGTASHYVSTGLIPEDFAHLMPNQVWEQDEAGVWSKVSEEPGNPQAVWQAASAQGVTCTLAQVQAIFATADVTEQEPFVAFDRLGLKIINPPSI